jgi:hypothetical protein
MTRPFKVLGIQQIAIGGPDKGRLKTLWVDLFGLEVTGTFQSERENVDEDICAIGVGPFKVLGIQQIAIGGPDKCRLKKLWVEMLGLEVSGTFQSERENVDEDICAIGVGPFKVEVDLMQPMDMEKKPAVHATPLNHVGLWIDDLPLAVQWLTAQGVALHRAVSAKVLRVLTSPSCTPRPTKSSRSLARGC